MSRTLFWDFDGTLAERNGAWTGTLISVLARNGYAEIKKEDVRPFLNVGFSWHSPGTPHSVFFGGVAWWEYYENYFCGIFERFGVSKQDSKRFATQVRQTYLDQQNWSVFDDVRPILTNLSSAGWRHIIASNHVPELEELIVSLGIRDLFASVLTSAAIGYEKPNVKFFEYILKSAQSDPRECVMIGDSYRADVSGALLVDMQPILVRSPNSKEFRWYSSDLKGVPGILEEMGVTGKGR